MNYETKQSLAGYQFVYYCAFHLSCDVIIYSWVFVWYEDASVIISQTPYYHAA